MNRWLIALLVSRCRRNRNVNLLLQANLAADDGAIRAWRNWLRVRCLEDATWSEARLLAPLARRIATLDPGSALRARLEGMAKAYWSRTQLTIRDGASAIDVLTNAGIDCLLLKGAAYYAEGLAPARRRIMADIDILVPREAVTMASDRLREAGWSGQYVEGFARDEVQISANYLKGEFGDIDLHRYAFKFSRRDRELDAALWENARPAHLAGRSVLIPDLADSIVISIAHGVANGDGDWAIDVDYFVRQRQIEWDRVSHIAERRGLVPTVLAGLTYLRTLGSDIPQSVLDQLHNARPTVGEYLKYFEFSFMRANEDPTKLVEEPTRLVNGMRRIANPLLPRDRYQYEF